MPDKVIKYVMSGPWYRLDEWVAVATPSINGLLSELSKRPIEHSPEQILRSIENGTQVCLALETDPDGDQAEYLAFYSDSMRIVGMATLSHFPKLGLRVGVVEDVIVTSAYLGRSIGKGLMNRLLETARVMGLDRIQLTSNDTRVVAQGLYLSVGFKIDTTFFRLDLKPQV